MGESYVITLHIYGNRAISLLLYEHHDTKSE